MIVIAGCRTAAPGDADVEPLADSTAESRDRHVQEILRSIGSRADRPAGEVFENVELLEAVPAERFLRIMDIGFGRSLGVGCGHCHDTESWESDDKRPKRAAREMIKMVGTINQDLLANIEELESEEPTVNCTTCHRGRVEPALNME